MPLPKEVRFHHFEYAYPGEQEAGIFRRIRQGVGGPDDLEPGAEVMGHLHVEQGQQVGIGEVHKMEFAGEEGDLEEVWEVEITSRETGPVSQEGEETKGYLVFGTCIREVGEY